jgi:hypothetical protein
LVHHERDGQKSGLFFPEAAREIWIIRRISLEGAIISEMTRNFVAGNQHIMDTAFVNWTSNSLKVISRPDVRVC